MTGQRIRIEKIISYDEIDRARRVCVCLVNCPLGRHILNGGEKHKSELKTILWTLYLLWTGRRKRDESVAAVK